MPSPKCPDSCRLALALERRLPCPAVPCSHPPHRPVSACPACGSRPSHPSPRSRHLQPSRSSPPRTDRAGGPIPRRACLFHDTTLIRTIFGERKCTRSQPRIASLAARAAISLRQRGGRNPQHQGFFGVLPRRCSGLPRTCPLSQTLAGCELSSANFTQQPPATAAKLRANPTLTPFSSPLVIRILR